MPVIMLPENNKMLSAVAGANLLDVLKENGIYPDAPCGGMAHAAIQAGYPFANRRPYAKSSGFQMLP